MNPLDHCGQIQRRMKQGFHAKLNRVRDIRELQFPTHQKHRHVALPRAERLDEWQRIARHSAVIDDY